MRWGQIWISATVLLLACALPAVAQQSSDVTVPPMVQFTGVLTDVNGKALTGLTGVTFYLYKDQQGGAPLWMETQNVQPNQTGHYSVMLGSTTSQGLPTDLFASGEARWLAVQPQGQEEKPRVMLLSVPYALKAGDAQTVGGLPPSAFVLAAPPAVNAASATGGSEAASVSSATSSDVTTAGGTVDTIPLFTTATNVQNSLLTQSGTKAINVGGKLNLPALGTATASTGFNSRPQDFVASAYKSTSKAAVPQTFQLQAEPTGNDTATASGTLNLLYTSGTGTPTETGLKISNKGLITFASGQTFPTVTGNETVTGELTASQLISTVATGTAPLKVTSTTEVTNLNASLLGGKAASAFAQLAAANTFTGNQTVDGNLSATGTVAGSSFEIGSNLFAFGSFANNNAFLGFAGNTTMTGTGNTATGFQALYSNINGTVNTAVGDRALYYNTLGNDNIAVGGSALGSNTTGSSNTAIGQGALLSNSIDSGNTAVGFDALENNYSINNTALGNTAVGFEALQESTTCCSTAVGSGALQSNTTKPNDAFGYGALNNNTTGDNNAAVGDLALNQNTEGNSNIALGQRALYSNTTGSENTAVGSTALSSNTTGNDLTCIGYACTASDSITNGTAIGAHARVEQSNSLVLGGTGDHAVKVGIGTTKPSNILTVGRGAGHAVSDSWETYSSRRWKTNIQPLQNALSKVEQLRGVSYDRKDSGKHEIGVIAEEVGKVVPEVVSYEKNGKDAQAVDYSRLTALLIEAVKQQQKQITAQQSLIRKQQWVTRAQQIEISTQRTLINTQQDEISGLSRKVGVLESSLPTGQPDKLAVLTLK
jgi:Chaperone of endosialidase